MSSHSDSAQGQAPKPIKQFAFDRTAPSSHGPMTVVNPERRPVPGETAPTHSAPLSAEWRRLFPGELDGDSGPLQAAGPAGMQLGHFVIEEQIGRGGMGAVFRALDQRLQRVVALKVLSPSQSQYDGAIQRFQNEARASARLDHDNIARVYFVGEDRGLHFIAYEYVTGSNLRDLILQHGRLSPVDAVNFTLQIASALRQTSAAGVVHRDIKPSNIIVTPNSRAKLVDLGLARKPSSDSLGELTMAGTTLGTFDYISPEQAKDPRSVDVRSDIYSLGCTLYHMLAGEPPYPDGTMLQKLLDHQGKDPPDPAKKNPRVTPELSAVVRKMMASDPKKRYATPDELIRDLLLIAGQLGVRGINPDALVWTAAGKPPFRRFWERHAGWISTAAALLLIVFLLDRYPDRFGNPKSGNPANETRPGDVDHAPPEIPQTAIIAAPANSRPVAVAGEAAGTLSAGPGTFPDNLRLPGAHPGPAAPGEGFGTPNLAVHPLAIGSQPVSPPLTGALSGSTTGSTAAPLTDPGKVFSEPEQLVKTVGSPLLPESGPAATPAAVTPPQVFPATGPETIATATTPPAGGGEVNSTAIVPLPGEIIAAPVAAETPAITIVGSGGKSFKTLEAACSEAADGAIIELRFNDRRIEKPFRISKKKIVIRAASGFRPLVEFRAVDELAGELQTRMITLSQAALDIIHVDLQLTTRADVDPSLQWALFSLQGADQVRLQQVNLFVDNASPSNFAAIFEMTNGTGAALSDMKMMNEPNMPLQRFEVKIVESFIRGDVELFLSRHTRPGRFDIEKSAVAVDRPLLNVLGNLDMSGESATLELNCDHVTVLLGRNLIRYDSGTSPRNLLPLRVSSRNSIYAGRNASAMVSMNGNTNSEDFRRLLQWNGSRNFYDGISTLWAINSQQGAGEFIQLDFESWKNFWGLATEVDALLGAVDWKFEWREKPSSRMINSDFMLEREAIGNPPVSGATDGSDAGVDLTILPAPRLEIAPDGQAPQFR